jgi:hypothetical protein
VFTSGKFVQIFCIYIGANVVMAIRDVETSTCDKLVREMRGINEI